MFRILCAHLATRRLVADVNIDKESNVADLKTLVLGKLAECDPSGQEHRVERWLFDAKVELGSEPSLAEIAEADDAKAVGALGLKNYSILYLDAPALPLNESLRPVKCFYEALLPTSGAKAAEISAIVTRLSCGLEAKVTSEDGIGLGPGSNGATPLFIAVKSKRTDVAIALVAAGANVNAASSEKHTALHMAAQTENVLLVEFLLSAGAELECRDVEGKTPLWHAAKMGNTSVVEALLAAGANVDAADNECRTPLHVASYWYTTTVKALLAGGANIDSADWDGNTPLHLATHYENLKTIDVIKALLAEGANVNTTAKNGQTPLHEAISRGHPVFVNLFWGLGLVAGDMAKLKRR